MTFNQNRGNNQGNRSNSTKGTNTQPIVKAFDIKKDNYADKAEEVIKSYGDNISSKTKDMITTSQLRPILTKINSMVERNHGKKGELTIEELSQLQYLKMSIAYSAGRSNGTKIFVERADIMEFIKRIVDGKNREDLELLGKYYESLVAYHRFYGGNDQ